MLVDKAAVDLQVTHEFVDAEIRAGAELIIRRDGQDYLVKLM